MNALTEAIRLAKRILELGTERERNMVRIFDLVQASPAAELPKKTGIGPVTAATACLLNWFVVDDRGGQ